MLYAPTPHRYLFQIATDERQSGRKWFDCAQCHHEQEDHPLLQKFEMTFACKKCKKCFRKDAQEFEDWYVNTAG